MFYQITNKGHLLEYQQDIEPTYSACLACSASAPRPSAPAACFGAFGWLSLWLALPASSKLFPWGIFVHCFLGLAGAALEPLPSLFGRILFSAKPARPLGLSLIHI